MSLSRTRSKTYLEAHSAASSAKRVGRGHHDPAVKAADVGTHYIGIVHHEVGTWGIAFPDLPGCMSAAASLAALPARAAEAIALWLEVDGEAGHRPPKPSELDAIRALPEAEDAMTYLPIPAPIADRHIRLNISLPKSLVQRIDARVGHRRRSAFLAELAGRALANG